MPVTIAGTGPLKFDGSKGTGVEAMVPEPESYAVIRKVDAAKPTLLPRPEAKRR